MNCTVHQNSLQDQFAVGSDASLSSDDDIADIINENTTLWTEDRCSTEHDGLYHDDMALGRSGAETTVERSDTGPRKMQGHAITMISQESISYCRIRSMLHPEGSQRQGTRVQSAAANGVASAAISKSQLLQDSEVSAMGHNRSVTDDHSHFDGPITPNLRPQLAHRHAMPDAVQHGRWVSTPAHSDSQRASADDLLPDGFTQGAGASCSAQHGAFPHKEVAAQSCADSQSQARGRCFTPQITRQNIRPAVRKSLMPEFGLAATQPGPAMSKAPISSSRSTMVGAANMPPSASLAAAAGSESKASAASLSGGVLSLAVATAQQSSSTNNLSLSAAPAQDNISRFTYQSQAAQLELRSVSLHGGRQAAAALPSTMPPEPHSSNNNAENTSAENSSSFNCNALGAQNSCALAPASSQWPPVTRPASSTSSSFSRMPLSAGQRYDAQDSQFIAQSYSAFNRRQVDADSSTTDSSAAAAAGEGERPAFNQYSRSNSCAALVCAPDNAYSSHGAAPSQGAEAAESMAGRQWAPQQQHFPSAPYAPVYSSPLSSNFHSINPRWSQAGSSDCPLSQAGSLMSAASQQKMDLLDLADRMIGVWKEKYYQTFRQLTLAGVELRERRRLKEDVQQIR